MPKINIINTDDFAEMRQGLGYYVDKTGFIEEFLQNPADEALFRVPSDATLITRPRRFGKTLFMSMLAEFFDIAKDSQKIFDGLVVSANEALCAQWMNQYPVIFLSLKDVEGDSFDEAIDEFNNKIVGLFNLHEEILATEKIWTGDRRAFEDIINRRATKGLLKDSLGILTRILTKYHQRKTIVLIDEYDAPVAKAADNGYYDKMIKFMRGFLSSALKTNRTYLKFGILTGCLRIARESIFSGLNNLKVYGISETKYADTFGFTQEETNALLSSAGLSCMKQELKEWYDGYCFGKQQEMYCPWSIMNFLEALQEDADTRPQPYWLNTSDNALIKRLFPGKYLEMADGIASLVSGGVLETQVNLTPTYESLDSSPKNLWSLLYLSGYLTKASEEQTRQVALAPAPRKNEMALVIPNREVREIFEEEVQNWFDEAVSNEQQSVLLEAFWAADTTRFKNELEAILLKNISSKDLAKDPVSPDSVEESPRENFYHGLLVGYFLVAYPKTLSNMEVGKGFYDIQVVDNKGSRAAIVEIKRTTNEKEDLLSLAEQGLTQIEKNRYNVRLLSDPGVTTLLHWSIAFCKKSCEAKAIIVRQP